MKNKIVGLTGAISLAFVLQGCLENTTQDHPLKNDLEISAMTSCATTADFKITQTSGKAYDIGVGPNSVWVIGTVPNGHGYRIYKQNGTGWADYGGGAVRIAMSDDVPNVVNNAGNVYFLSGTWVKYTDLNGGGNTVTDIGATKSVIYQSESGTPWYSLSTLAGTDWHYDGSNDAAYGDLNRVTELSGNASSDNDFWAVNKGGTDANPIWQVLYRTSMRHQDRFGEWIPSTWGVVSTWTTEVYDVAAAGNGAAYITTGGSRQPNAGLVYRISKYLNCAEPVMNTALKPPTQMVAKHLSAKDDNTVWFTDELTRIWMAQR